MPPPTEHSTGHAAGPSRVHSGVDSPGKPGEEPAEPSREPFPAWLGALVLVAAAFAAYWPSLPGDFFWDDDSYVTENELLRDPDGWRDVWTPETTPQYYPVVFSVLWLEFQAFGLEPRGYHLVNLSIHALSGLLAWALFRRLGVRGAWWIGTAFALHPLHVETVAWTMELKNVLSGFFYLLAAHAYLAFDERAFRPSNPTPRASWSSGVLWVGALAAFVFALWSQATTYAFIAALALALVPKPGARASWMAGLLWLASLAAFTCALWSKTVTCTLPAALVLALFWKRAPLRGGLRILPLGALVAVGVKLAVFTAGIEAEFVGAQGSEFAFSAAERLIIASRAALFYAAQLLAPITLLFQYPRWEIDPADIRAWWSVATVGLLLAYLVREALRGRRGALLAALFFGGTISPALGFVNFYPMIFSFVADHFCYLASLGVLAVAGSLLARLPGRTAHAVGLLLLALLGLRTARRADDFSSAATLYRHTLEHHPEAWLAHSALGSLKLNAADEAIRRGEFDAARPQLEEARDHFAASTELYGKRFPDHVNLALARERLGDLDGAVESALEAARIKPLFGRTRGLAGTLLVRVGRPSEALEHLGVALQLEPTNAVFLEAMGSAYAALGNEARAVEYYRTANRGLTAPVDRIRIGSQLAGLLANATDAGVRDPQRALALVEDLARLVPNFVPQLEQARADALGALGRTDEARALAERLLSIARGTGVDAYIEAARARLERLDR